MLGMARGPAMPWLPAWWRNALILVFPLYPLHMAIGYDFYARFPPGVSTTRLWRGIRVGLYIVCGVLFVFGALVDTVMYHRRPRSARGGSRCAAPGGPLARVAGVAGVSPRRSRHPCRGDAQLRRGAAGSGSAATAVGALGNGRRIAAVSHASRSSPSCADRRDAVRLHSLEPAREPRDRGDSDQFRLRDHQTPRLRHHFRRPPRPPVSARQERAARSCWRCRLPAWPTACWCIATSRSSGCSGPTRFTCT